MNKKTIVSTLRLRRIAIVVFALVAMLDRRKRKQQFGKTLALSMEPATATASSISPSM